MIMAVGFSAGSAAFSSLSQDIVMRSTGTIGLEGMIAPSGSPADIQATVNAVNSAGGGTVYIPAGTFHWNGETVRIPAGVSVVGASYAGCMGRENNWQHYTATTILHNDATQPFDDMFIVDGSGGKNGYTRISGIQFEANDPPVGSESTGAVRCAISVREAKNFRIDHCSIINFAYRAIMVQTGWSAWPSELGHSTYGVIDHCFLDAPYKDNGHVWEVAYGIVVFGNMQPRFGNWNPNVRQYAGKYQDFADVALVYVEDCNFRRMRHSVDGANGAVLVTRYCLFDHLADYQSSLSNTGEVCVHPYWSSQYPPVLAEAYHNSFVNADMHRSCPIHPDQPHSLSAIVQRGSSGLYFGNDYYQSEPAPSWNSFLILLREESTIQPTISETYIWDEDGRYMNVWPNDGNGDGIVDGFITCNGSPRPELNVNFFLRQPNSAQDGWDYTPYPYPHPLIGG